MADTPTPPAGLRKSGLLACDVHQNIKPAWTSFVPSPPLQFPPTPTTEIQDDFAMLLEKSAMASDAQNREIKDILLSTSERLSRDDIKAIVKETAKIKKSTPEALSYDQIRTIVRASVTAKQLAAQKKKTISASPSQPRVGAQLATPPISPDSPAGNTIDQAPAQTSNAKDPILYPGGSENHDGATPAPLFTPTPAVAKSLSPETERLVDQHIASRPVELFPDSSSAPTREDYKLALYFASNCFSQYRANPKRWLHQERQLLIDHRRRIDRPVRPAKLPEILPAEKSAVLGIQTRNKATAAPARVEKHVLPKKPKVAKKPQQPRPIRATPAATATTPTATAAVAALITAAPIATSHATSARLHTPDTPRARTVAPSREDKDFSALADLCPPLSTLDRQKANCLKVDWKGNALDLSTDPHRALLHPDELALASNLRLDCATYLTSKRRIFLKRLECARMPKEFRKTDAQQACKIDVNKASKLWQAYERVGWLDEGWIRRFM